MALSLSYIGVQETIKEIVTSGDRWFSAKPLISKQVLRHCLAHWLAEAETIQQLTYHIVRMKTAGLDVTRKISMEKLLAGDLSERRTRELSPDVRGVGDHERDAHLPPVQGCPAHLLRRRRQ